MSEKEENTGSPAVAIQGKAGKDKTQMIKVTNPMRSMVYGASYKIGQTVAVEKKLAQKAIKNGDAIAL